LGIGPIVKFHLAAGLLIEQKEYFLVRLLAAACHPPNVLEERPGALAKDAN
jgi:hypothetical protein